jgi:hypothetical protein
MTEVLVFIGQPLRFSALRLLEIAEGSRERLPRRFRDCDRAGLQSPRPVRQARLSVPLETFVTLAAIRRLARM